MHPRALLLWLTAALGVAGIVAAFIADLQPPVLVACAGLSLLAAIDALALLTIDPPSVERHVSRTLPLGSWSRVTLNITTTRKAKLAVFDHYPAGFAVRGMPQQLLTPAAMRSSIDYKVKATTRGDHQFTLCEVCVQSPLGLFSRRFRLPESHDVFVYPNFAAVTKYALRANDDAFSQTGIRRQRRRGEGLEFHQLREYRQGDTFRQIDWKATARKRKIISKEYQDERDQNIVFLLDTGRRMLTQEGPLSHFDHVLNAMLLLSYVALRQGDSVGLYTMGANPRWVAPRKGVAAINPLLRRMYDLQPSAVAVDYAGSATALAVRQKRRALVVVLTNVRDEDSDDLQAAIRLLRSRHLVMIASLRENAVDEALDKPVTDLSSALQFSATLNYLEARSNTHKDLRSSGVYIHDTLCEDLPAVITNRYLSIKRAGLL